jgi:hypothetical protein
LEELPPLGYAFIVAAGERDRERRGARVELLPDDASGLSHSELSQAVADARSAYGTWSVEATTLALRMAEVLESRTADDELAERAEDGAETGEAAEAA